MSVKHLLVALGITVSMVSHAQTETQKFPNVIQVKVNAKGGDVFDFDVTISSPYDTASRYADAFRVTDKQGKVLGERILFHDHADEQPFTRDLHGLKLPANLTVVTVQSRDKKNGYGGRSIDVNVPGRNSR